MSMRGLWRSRMGCVSLSSIRRIEARLSVWGSREGQCGGGFGMEYHFDKGTYSLPGEEFLWSGLDCLLRNFL